MYARSVLAFSAVSLLFLYDLQRLQQHLRLSLGREVEVDMERATWLNGAVDSAQARFIMIAAITHHRFSSPIWGEHEVRKLHAELAEIELSAKQSVAAAPSDGG